MDQPGSTAIKLTDDQAGILKEVLDAKLIDLRREISHTDSPRFRETLHQVERVLERVLEQLPVTRSA